MTRRHDVDQLDERVHETLVADIERPGAERPPIADGVHEGADHDDAQCFRIQC